MTELRGVVPMLVTPFGPDGSVAYGDLDRLVADQLEAGVPAISCLGLAGEAGVLSVEEREAVTRSVIASAEGLPVVVGCTAQDTDTAVRLATMAAEAGAAAVMVAPPSVADWTRDDLLAHYASVARALGDTAVMVQDAPVFVGVALDAPFILELAREHGNVRLAKPESIPVADAVGELADVPGLAVFGGHGGCYLIETLEAGADGVIPGPEHPAVLQQIYETWTAGSHEQARAMFRDVLPLLSWQFQSLECYVASVKTVLVAKGIIGRADLRDRRFELGPWTRHALLVHAAHAGALTTGQLHASGGRS